MRATHVIHELHPGGAEQVLVDLAAAFPAAGVDLSVVSLMPTEGQAHAVALERLGVPVTTLALPTRWDPRGLSRAVDAVAATAPDVVHTHMKHADLVGAFATRRLDVPLVSTLHLIEDAVSPVDRGKRWLASQARLHAAAATVAVSEAVRRWYLDAFPRAAGRSVVTIRNGRSAPAPLTADGRLSLRDSLGLGGAAPIAANVGIMRPGKGQSAVLEAAARLVAAGSDLRFLLIGDGELRPQLEQQARELGLGADRVMFAGYRDDVPALLQACDLLVHASDFDALPTALIEGLAAGVPTVAYRVGGVPEIVTAGTGCLVAPGDVAALADALGGLARDPEQRAILGAAAREHFAAEFEAGRFASRLHDLYRTVREQRDAA